MKINILKLTAFAAAMVLGVSAFSGCGKRKEKATLELNMDNSWRTEACGGLTHSPIFTIGTHILCGRTRPDKSTEYLWYDMETKERKTFFLRAQEEKEALEHLEITEHRLPDDRIAFIGRAYQNVRGKEVTKRRFAEIYDSSMNYLETREIPTEPFGETQYIRGQQLFDSSGNWYVLAYNYNYMQYDQTGDVFAEVFNSEYEKYGEIKLPRIQGATPRLFTDQEGKMHAAIITYDADYNGYTKVYKLDAEGRTCEDTGVVIPEDVYYFTTGTQGYDYYYMTDNGLYGVSENEAVKVIDWINSDYKPEEVRWFYPLDDGTFLLTVGGRAHYHATPRSQEEIDSTKLISLATVGLTEDLLDAVIDYNVEESGYRIIVKDYGEYNTMENPHQGYETMKMDMLDGIVADMICTDGVNFESLATKGMFGNWYTLMDADKEFDRGDYLTNYFETHEYDGELQRLGFSYKIETTVAKTKHIGDRQGMSLGEQVDFPVPENMDVYCHYPAEYMIPMYLRYLQTGCIDRETAKCCFDAPEVVQVLEMLNRVPQEDDYYKAVERGEFSDNVYLCDDGVYRGAYELDRMLFYFDTFEQPIDLRGSRRANFADVDITLAGFPMVWDEGNGGVFNTPFTVSFNDNSAEKTAIWDFVKHLLSEDYQKSLYHSMPILESALEYKLDEAEHLVTAKVGEMFIGEMEPWETDIMRDYIYGIRTCWYYDETVYRIMLEETEKMMAGDQTPEEAAKMMQSRVSIYLSEQS
ncbi:MAG: hypothetical protein E7504_01895 [Ruminococcus sp.]|nr:hypothetical protein [Ruminococcus sp.]